MSSLRYPPLRPRTYRAVRAVLRTAFRVACRWHVSGLENVLAWRGGPLLLVTNHLSDLDGLLLFSAMPFMFHGVARAQLRASPVHHLFDIAGTIYIERDRPDRKALQAVLDALADGEAVGIAIEGEPSPTGALIRGKTGVAYLAKRSGARVLPVAMYGIEHAATRLQQLCRPEIHVTVGPILDLPPGPLDVAKLEADTTRIMTAIAALLPARYRGVYEADTERLLAGVRGERVM